MKHFLFLTLLIAGATISLRSQSFEFWSAPVPFTDSSSYNSNACLVYATPMIFYEKKSDSLATSGIYCVNLYSNYGEVEVLNDDSITYRDPKVLRDNKILLYESNETGNFEIYAMPFDLECNFGEPVQLTFSPENESSVNLTENKMVFLRDDAVVIAGLHTSDSVYITDLYVIDTLPSANPQCYYSGKVFWQRFEDGNWHIYKQYSQGGQPEPVMTEGNNTDLKLTPSNFLSFIPQITWRNNNQYLSLDFTAPNNVIIDTLHKFDTLDAKELYPFNIQFDKGLYYNYYAFTTGDGENREIMIYEFDVLRDITQNNRKDSNPRLFYGPEHSNYFDFYCIWETEINGYSTLFYSKTEIYFGNVKEITVNNIFEVSPNPFGDKLQITLLNPSETATIEIFSATGECVFGTSVKNRENITWEPGKASSKINGGIYFVTVKQSDKITVEKVIFRN